MRPPKNNIYMSEVPATTPKMDKALIEIVGKCLGGERTSTAAYGAEELAGLLERGLIEMNEDDLSIANTSVGFNWANIAMARKGRKPYHAVDPALVRSNKARR